MNHKISKLILKKTTAFFKISLILFIVSFSLLIVAITLLLSRYQQIEDDFINNPNTHLIEITSFSENKFDVGALNFNDIESIKEISSSQGSISNFVFADYMINFGIENKESEVFYIKSFEHTTSDFFEIIENDTALINPYYLQKNMILNIPKIQISNGGFSSSSSVAMDISLKQTQTNHLPVSYINFHSDTLYVNNATFQNMIEKMYDLEWDDFVIRYSLGEDFGINVIDKIYVYVEKLEDIQPLAKSLSNYGYNLNYLTSGFEDISSSIQSNIFVFLLIGLVIFSVTTINIVIAFKNYLLHNRKDIGVFKFYGYSPDKIHAIYILNINKIFYTVFCINTLLTIVLGSAFIARNTILFIVTLLVIQVLFLIIMQLLIQKFLKTICDKEILSLIDKKS